MLLCENDVMVMKSDCKGVVHIGEPRDDKRII
jgi:hypothetical protein